MMRPYIEKACDEIDAAIFSGDAFLDRKHRKELRDYMARWERQLIVWEELDKDEYQ